MSKDKLGDIISKKSKEVDPLVSEISIFKQLIAEHAHPLDLIRELLSNSGSQEVGATKIEISYTKDREGHIFEISDNGCGMYYTGNKNLPGRLDKFLGLGLSGIVGIEHDEFSWKGLGSKLSYQSRRVEIETCAGPNNPFYDVRINEPWDTISNNRIPKPRITEHPSDVQGTKIRVVGHPSHRLDEPFRFQEIKSFLQHRTFAGYTGKRKSEPEIYLSVLGKNELIPFGFPEFKNIDFDTFSDTGLLLNTENKTLYIDMIPSSSKSMRVRVKGFITWKPELFNLSKENLNTGLMLSVKGIPYFNLNMEDFGVTTIRTARPGEARTCLVIECDSIQNDLNISRSNLVDSPKSLELKRIVTEIFQRIESSLDYLSFRTIPEKDKFEGQSGILEAEKRKILEKDQKWVVLEKNGKYEILMREPNYEQETNALIWKLEALKALPFEKFTTLAYIGGSKGPDMLVNFQEDKGSEPQLATVFEIENNFYSYKSHGHTPSQYPKVLCWDIPSAGRKVKLNKTTKPYKFTLTTSEYQVHIFVIRLMDNIKLMTREELEELEVAF